MTEQQKCIMPFSEEEKVLIKNLNCTRDTVLQTTVIKIYCARQHICYSAYMLSPVRPSVCLSVCHTGDSVKNG